MPFVITGNEIDFDGTLALHRRHRQVPRHHERRAEDARPQHARRSERHGSRSQGRRPTSSVTIPRMLEVEAVSQAVRVLTLDRPDALNAMNAELCRALHEELDRIKHDRVVSRRRADRRRPRVLRRPRPARLRRRARQRRHRRGARPARLQEHMSRLILKLRETPQPVIAAINGPAAGFGFALALGSDIRYAVEGRGAARDLREHRRVELRHGHELAAAAAGRRLACARADADRPPAERRRGRATSGSSPRSSTASTCSTTPSRPPSRSPPGRRGAIRLTKQGMWTALEIPSLRAAIEYEDRQQIMATFGAAPSEAVSAFLEKRPAAYRTSQARRTMGA